MDLSCGAREEIKMRAVQGGQQQSFLRIWMMTEEEALSMTWRIFQEDSVSPLKKESEPIRAIGGRPSSSTTYIYL
jgi:hypothetical protein